LLRLCSDFDDGIKKMEKLKKERQCKRKIC
jgi:hypothetical protein